MHSLQLTSAAATDLEEIFTYTLKRYGHSQARVYRDGIVKAFDVLLEHPLLGSDQGDIRPNIRRFVHEAHAIYYQTGEREMLVVRILGPGQDPLEEL